MPGDGGVVRGPGMVGPILSEYVRHRAGPVGAHDDAPVSAGVTEALRVIGQRASPASDDYLSFERVDLRDAHLAHTDFQGGDLSGADLSGADLKYANLQDADLRGANLNGADLHSARLRGTDLAEAVWT